MYPDAGVDDAPIPMDRASAFDAVSLDEDRRDAARAGPVGPPKPPTPLRAGFLAGSGDAPPPSAEIWERVPTVRDDEPPVLRPPPMPAPAPKPTARPRRPTCDNLLKDPRFASMATNLLPAISALGHSGRPVVDGSSRYVVLGADPGAPDGDVEIAMSIGADGALKPCALRWLDADSARDPAIRRARFLTEAQLGRRVNHPNVLKVHAYGNAGGVRYLCRELITGVRLRRLTTGRLSIPAIVSICRAVAEALAYAHELTDDDGAALDVVHGELSPSSVTVTWEGVPKITEMSIGSIGRRPLRPPDEARAGHPGYVAPEQHFGQPIDARTDLFALGVIMAELIAGEPVGAVHWSAPRAFVGRVRERCNSRPGLPKLLVELIEDLTAPRPEDRPPSAGVVVDVLHKVRRIVGDWVDRETELRSAMNARPSWVEPASIKLRSTAPPSCFDEGSDTGDFTFEDEDLAAPAGSAPLVMKPCRIPEADAPDAVPTVPAELEALVEPHTTAEILRPPALRTVLHADVGAAVGDGLGRMLRWLRR